MVYWAPDYDLSSAMTVRPSGYWWILSGIWHHCDIGGPAMPWLAQERVGQKGGYTSHHIHRSAYFKRFSLEIRQTLLGPSFLGQKPDKEGWDSNSPAWSWPSLITQNICQLLIKPQPSPEFVETIFFPFSTDCLHLPWLGFVFTCTSPLVLCPLPLPLPSLCLGL